MASSSAGGPAAAAGPSTTAGASRARSKKDQLFERCLEKPLGYVFALGDLEQYGIAETQEDVLALADQLCDAHLFIMMQTAEKEVMWKLRPKETADLIRSLTTNERLVYQRIEEAENSGIWLRTITNRVNLHQTVVTKALKDLKSKRLVKEIKSAKFPTKKMYMLFDLEPSEENTGGAFFSEGEMDVGLVEALSGVVTDWVEKQSWAEVSTPVPHSHSHSHHSHHPQKKRKREDGTPAPVAPSLPIADAPKYKQPLSRQRKPLVPHSQSYQFYPTAADILDFIKNCDMLTPSARLRFIDKDVEVLLDMLVYDGRLERMAEDRYRSVRRSFEDAFVGKPGDQEKQREEGMGNGCSDAPCGRCPVFHLCEPGGPVSAENCVYFDEWLKF